MKRLLLICAMLCTFAQAQAVGPRFRLGVKAGLDYQANDFSDRLKNLEFESNSGWFAGVQADLSWGGFGIHPEILYSHNKFGVSEGATGNIKLNKLDVPVLLQYTLLNFISLQAGPSFCIMTDTAGRIGDVKWDLERPTVGYAAGVEIRVWKVSISGRYNGSFSRSKVLGFSTGKNKADNFQLGVGFYF